MMKFPALEKILFAFFVFSASLFYFNGLPDVPFHPDESTQIFMSGDWELFSENPANLFWSSDKNADIRQHYRLLDASLTRWMIGLGRSIARLPAPAADWNWSSSWAQNATAGALPDDHLLFVSRLSVAWLFPLSLLLIYHIGVHLGGKVSGWAAAILLAANPLVLIHTRRAMAESTLLFFALLTILAILRCRHRLWLIAVPLALAINAKQSSIALLVPGIAVLLKQPANKMRQFIISGLIVVLVTFALNPFLWSNPPQAAWQAWQERRYFTEVQVSTLKSAGYGAVTRSIPQRISGMLVQTFISDPAVFDVPNYAEITRSAEWNYLANPLHNLFRGRRGGFPILLLTFLGFSLGAYQVIRKLSPRQPSLTLLLITTLIQSLALIVFFKIGFQRYYLLLIPYVCLWSGFALQTFVDVGRQAVQKIKKIR